MGQLVKLRDYISRYETDVYYYVPEFIRLKQWQWEQAKSRWEAERNAGINVQTGAEETWDFLLDKPSWWERLAKRWRRVPAEEEEEPPAEAMASRAATVEELKRQFLDELFQLQLKWASSTMTHASPFDDALYGDETLKYFLQRFPDTYLCFYRPVAMAGKALVELETIILTPAAAWCIAFVEGKPDNVVIASTGRFWTERAGTEETKRVNPVVSLRRTEQVVSDVFQKHRIDWPIHLVLLNRYGYIDHGHLFPFLHYIDKRNYEQWFSRLRRSALPLRHQQLKAAAALLGRCASFYSRRLDGNIHSEERQQ
ncbi:glucanohydrolase [Geobacillus sp. 46C-IIa]|uniref:glucanohydrolase n=1 Tax=Geobacillus sp. 46C-IIa TaxID=1963025 RepID=UPI0009BE701B|nr:glucanohydrolase [Geobacillus sp. 46C-IIa]OQP06475.1 glucanohydrolase [Geobacillus sp. 46C-IIa]QNU28493.1 NERD domain-containing protein [Geobacillus sp. 46C-IIa]